MTTVTSAHAHQTTKALDLIPADAASPLARVLAAGTLIRFRDKGISNDTDAEFALKVANGVDQLRNAHPNLDLSERAFNVFGFGHVAELLSDGERGFFWGHDFAEALGMDAAAFGKIARNEYLHDLETQREADLEHDTIGWDCLRWWPMKVSAWTGPGSADEHYVNGSMRGPIMGNWTDLWLVDSTLITYLALLSPHGEDIQKAAEPMFAHGFRKSGLGEIADVLGGKDHGITEEDAIRKAMRGPRPTLTVVKEPDAPADVWSSVRMATAALGGEDTPANRERAEQWLDDLVNDALGTPTGDQGA